MKTIKNNFLLLLSFTLLIALAGVSCEGPGGTTGPQGPQGEQGPEGPVGPAGENGSELYADEGEPGEEVGDIGDYYLNQNTGELYGPKSQEGWGSPIIVLMGEDGQDGEAGSQIYSGTAPPDVSLGVEGDFYLDRSSYELYGPKTGGGWGTPLNLKGADGNANVTRYIFPGHDFSAESSTQRLIFGADNGDESLWLTYLVAGDWKFFIPGYGPSGNSEYREQHAVSASDTFDLRINLQSGPGENFDNIYVVRIEAGTIEDRTKQAVEGSVIPDHLDVSDYEAVAGYFGFK